MLRQGATVIKPECGIHKYVLVFDFNSMYPIIILKYNLCYTSWTADGTLPGAFGVLKVSTALPKAPLWPIRCVR